MKIRFGVLAYSLVLAAAMPALAQTPEPAARRIAAVADYHRICAALLDIPGYSSEYKEQLFIIERGGSYPQRATVENLRRNMPGKTHPRNLLHICALEVAIRHLQQGVPGYDHSVGVGRAPAPAPSPRAAPKAAAPAEKLPKARPAKMAPWSPMAMSTNPEQALSAQFAAERTDALASCSAPIGRYAAHHKITPTEANFLVEQVQLQDRSIDNDVQVFRDHIANMQRQIAAGNLPPGDVIARQIAVCTFTRRIAQLEGSPLVTGAVDGTLTPLSVGGQTPPWKQQGKDARIIASDGKSAMDCVKLEQLASGNSSTSGGGRVLSNQCSGEVEIVWCYSPGDCDTETGSGWTVQAGKSWPVSANKEIRWVACHGRDSARFVKGSHGLRYYCRAPARK